jgi:hypothetical protein
LITVGEARTDVASKGLQQTEASRTNIASPDVSNRQARSIMSSAPSADYFFSGVAQIAWSCARRYSVMSVFGMPTSRVENMWVD